MRANLRTPACNSRHFCSDPTKSIHLVVASSTGHLNTLRSSDQTDILKNIEAGDDGDSRAEHRDDVQQGRS